MNINIRGISAGTALVFSVASSVAAQSLATFGSIEAGGFGEGSALLGTSASTGHPGWGPTASIVAQTYRYRNDLHSHAQAYTISPSVGVQNSMPEGSVSAMLGYTFVNTEFTGVVSGAELGGKNGTFASVQGNYWGSGENSAQVIGSYGFDSEYYWTRFRAAHRAASGANPVYLGAELVLQGTQKTQTTGLVTTPSQFRYEAGPTLEYRVTSDFRIGASGGLRAGNNNTPSSGYVRVEFLLLTKLGGM